VRIELHFTPTSASWLNLVEVFFSIVERQALRRGDFASVQELVAPSVGSVLAGTSTASRCLDQARWHDPRQAQPSTTSATEH
jgi:hypothetical protein